MTGPAERDPQSAGWADTPGSPLPLGINCLGCGYDLSLLPSRRCPECGREVDAGQLRSSQTRAEFLSPEAARRRRRTSLYLVIAAFWPIPFAIIVFGVDELRSSIVLSVLCLSALVATSIPGFLAALSAPREDRKLELAVSQSLLFWLNLPWAVAIPAIGLVIQLIRTFPGPWSRPLLAAFGLSSVVGVAFISLAWASRYSRQRERLQLHSLAAGLVGVLGGLLVYAMIALPLVIIVMSSLLS